MFINLTPHSIQVFAPDAFVGLVQKNATTWVANGTYGDPIIDLPSVGCARISVCTESVGESDGVPLYATVYGDAIGVPDSVDDGDLLVVSLPMMSMAKASKHPLANRMVCPYGVVRSASDGSLVHGCMGFTF